MVWMRHIRTLFGFIHLMKWDIREDMSEKEEGTVLLVK